MKRKPASPPSPALPPAPATSPALRVVRANLISSQQTREVDGQPCEVLRGPFDYSTDLEDGVAYVVLVKGASQPITLWEDELASPDEDEE
jgi:hypothetical protein